MQGKPEEIAALRDDYERRMRAGEMPIEMLMKTDTLQDSLEKYRQKIGAGGRNRAAALRARVGQRQSLQTRRPISYYIKAPPKKVAAYEAAKLASDFDPQNRDENVDYYVGKLGELVEVWGCERGRGEVRREAGEPGAMMSSWRINMDNPPLRPTFHVSSDRSHPRHA